MNDWNFTGKIFYMKELSGEFCYSLKLRGEALRDGDMASRIVELPCLVPTSIKNKKIENLKLYDNVTMSGHFETWSKFDINGHINGKSMNIVDCII